MHSNRLSLLSTAAVIAAALLAGAPAAQARERQVSVHGSQGKSLTRQVSRSDGDVSSSTTLGNGKTASRTVDRSADGTQATLTGPNGATATRSTTKTDTGSSTTISTGSGKSATVDITRQP